MKKILIIDLLCRNFEIAASILGWIKDDNGVVNRSVAPYKISNPIKARVLVINVQNYYATKDLKGHERSGSEKDVNSLCQALYNLGVKADDISIKGPTVEKGQLIAIMNSFGECRG